jgi:ABC-type dipeptide/oligopeptide/nickel transport system permease subunit
VASPASDIDQITDKDVRFENVRAMNATRWIIVIGMFVVFVVTLVGSMLGAFFGSSGRWGQLSPVVDTALAGEFAIFGAIVAFYMTRQD